MMAESTGIASTRAGAAAEGACARAPAESATLLSRIQRREFRITGRWTAARLKASRHPKGREVSSAPSAMWRGDELIDRAEV